MKFIHHWGVFGEQGRAPKVGDCAYISETDATIFRFFNPNLPAPDDFTFVGKVVFVFQGKHSYFHDTPDVFVAVDGGGKISVEDCDIGTIIAALCAARINPLLSIADGLPGTWKIVNEAPESGWFWRMGQLQRYIVWTPPSE